ncbi:MAG: glycine cleavage system aminomethyltransferase GcvT, partial [Candidatus Hydrogenedentes bacterium]|nr:glycine cleavage system aminomethyltransferase GcvT [Candidatus Hydrogenedentota bacterium]
KLVGFAGWDMPVQYGTGILKEHLATRKFGGLFDVSHMGRFRIGGEHGIRFLQHVLSNNAEAPEPLMAQYTMIQAEEEGVLDDCYLYRLPDETILLVVNAANAEKDWAYLRQHAAVFDDASLEDDTEKTSMIAFQGPLTGEVLERVLEAGSLPEPQRNSISAATISETEVLIARTGYTGEPIGFEIFVPAEKAELVWTRLYEAGKDEGIVPVGLGARDTLRLESGMPLYGHELGLDPDGVPIPAFSSPLAGAAISFSGLKGDYIGRKRLTEQFEQIGRLYAGLYEPSDALRRCIRPLALLDRGVARQGHEVFIGNRKVGVVTSGTMIPFWLFEGEGATMTITDEHRSRAIALAYLDAEVEPDQEVEVAVRSRRLKALVVRWHGRSEAPPYFRSIPVGVRRAEREPAVGEGTGKALLLTEKAIENHEWRQQRCINLIPSEMTPSPLVRLLQVTDPIGRYAEHKELIAAFEQEVFYYQGTDFIAWVEDR